MTFASLSNRQPSLLAERFKLALRHKQNHPNAIPGNSFNALAEHVGVSISMVSHWFQGKTDKLSYTAGIKAAEFFGVSSDWLALGTGEMVVLPEPANSIEDVILVHRMPGTDGPSSDTLPFSRRVLGSRADSTSSLMFIEVKNEGYFKPGDIALIDNFDTVFRDEVSVFLFELDNKLFFARPQLVGGTLRIVKEIPGISRIAYRAEDLTNFGRVVMYVNRVA